MLHHCTKFHPQSMLGSFTEEKPKGATVILISHASIPIEQRSLLSLSCHVILIAYSFPESSLHF